MPDNMKKHRKYPFDNDSTLPNYAHAATNDGQLQTTQEEINDLAEDIKNKSKNMTSSEFELSSYDLWMK
jgi:hypothetical protein